MVRNKMMAVVDWFRTGNAMTGFGAIGMAEGVKTLFWIMVAIAAGLLIGQLS